MWPGHLKSSRVLESAILMHDTLPASRISIIAKYEYKTLEKLLQLKKTNKITSEQLKEKLLQHKVRLMQNVEMVELLSQNIQNSKHSAKIGDNDNPGDTPASSFLNSDAPEGNTMPQKNLDSESIGIAEMPSANKGINLPETCPDITSPHLDILNPLEPVLNRYKERKHSNKHKDIFHFRDCLNFLIADYLYYLGYRETAEMFCKKHKVTVDTYIYDLLELVYNELYASNCTETIENFLNSHRIHLKEKIQDLLRDINRYKLETASQKDVLAAVNIAKQLSPGEKLLGLIDNNHTHKSEILERFQSIVREIYKQPLNNKLLKRIEIGLVCYKTHACGPKDEDKRSIQNENENQFFPDQSYFFHASTTNHGPRVGGGSYQEHSENGSGDLEKAVDIEYERLPINNCPACLPLCAKLLPKIPVCKKDYSIVLCQSSRKIMDYNNQPYLFETGYLYSYEYLRKCSYKYYCSETGTYCKKDPKLCYFM